MIPVFPRTVLIKSMLLIAFLTSFFTITAHAEQSQATLRIVPDDPLVDEMMAPETIWKPYRPPIDSGNGMLWLRVGRQSAAHLNDHLFMYPVPRYYEVYQNGNLIDQSHPAPTKEPRISRLLNWTMIPLNSETSSSDVFIRLEGRAPFMASIGSESALIGEMVKLDAVNGVLIIAFMVISAFSLLLSFVHREGRLLLYYSLFLFHHFVLLLAGTQLLSKQLLFPLPPMAFFYWYLIGSFLDFILLLLLFKQLLPSPFRRWVLSLVYLYSGIGFLSIAAVTVYPASFTIVMSAAGMISLLGVRMFIISLSAAALWKRRDPELLAFSVGFACFVALDLLLNIAMQLVQVPWVFTIKALQPLAITVPGGWIVWRRYREAVRKGRDYSDALKRMTLRLQEHNDLLEESVSKRTTELEEVHHLLVSHVQEKADAELAMAALAERNRIAQEIHDIVGHTLTTTIIQIEAGKLFIDQSPNQTKERLEIAQGLVRRGLEEIRGSVRLLREAEWSYDLTGAMEKLIKETELAAGVEIRRKISTLPELSMEQKNILYLALREGLTNGIKHGASTTFELSLSYDEPLVIFQLRNNGKPMESLKLGFGLQAMKQRIEHAEGWLRLSSNDAWNVVIDIRLPA